MVFFMKAVVFLADALQFGTIEHLGQHSLGDADAVLGVLLIRVLVKDEAHLGLERLESDGTAHDDAVGACSQGLLFAQTRIRLT